MSREMISRHSYLVSVLFVGASVISTALRAETLQAQFSGSHRIRYEFLQDQFRPNFKGNDETLSLRTLLKLELSKGALQVGAELEDSRAYLNDDDNGFVATSVVNSVALLQAYLGYRWQDIAGAGTQLALRGGRMTLDIGSRRLVPRNRFRNTIQNYTGLWSQYQAANGAQLTGFFVLPVQIEPSERSRLLDNAISFDEEDFDQRLWGLHYAWPVESLDFTTELYLIGFNEDDDTSERQTRNRSLYNPGFRLYRSPKIDRWDFDIETIIQFGQRRATTRVDDRKKLDVFAHFHHVELAYQFASKHLRIGLEYDFASGDSRKAGEYHRFDTLFGPRRRDFGPTGIYGILGRENIHSLGSRVSLRPLKDFNLSVSWRANFADESADTFARSGLVNSAVDAKRFAGHQIDTQVAYWLLPKQVKVEAGTTFFIRGSLLRNADNANSEGDPFYLYSSLEWQF